MVQMQRLQSRHALTAHTKLTVSRALMVWKVSVPDSWGHIEDCHNADENLSTVRTLFLEMRPWQGAGQCERYPIRVRWSLVTRCVELHRRQCYCQAKAGLVESMIIHNSKAAENNWKDAISLWVQCGAVFSNNKYTPATTVHHPKGVQDLTQCSAIGPICR